MTGEISEWEPIDPEILRMLEERVYVFRSPVPLNIPKVLAYLRKASKGRVTVRAGLCESILEIEGLRYKMRVIFHPVPAVPPQVVEVICTTVPPETANSDLYMQTCAHRLANQLPRRSLEEMEYIKPQ